jgi:porin
VLQIHGRSLSPYYLGDLQTASGTVAENSTRLWEFWYDQGFNHGSWMSKSASKASIKNSL